MIAIKNKRRYDVSFLFRSTDHLSGVGEFKVYSGGVWGSFCTHLILILVSQRNDWMSCGCVPNIYFHYIYNIFHYLILHFYI